MAGLRKWWFWFLLVVIVAAGVVGYRYWAKSNAAPAYRTATVERGALTAGVSATGTLSPVVSVQVGSQVSGQLKEVLADFNSEVKQGQLIARIDPQTFEYRVQQAQADVDAARSQVLTQQANVAAQQAEVSRVRVTLADAELDFDRKQSLVDKGFISASERDKSRAARNALSEQLKTAQAQVRVAQANAVNAAAVVKQREAALAQARIDLERTAIRAPVNGIVIKRSVEQGQTVAASLQAPELFIIAENLADMRVDTAIDEAEIGRIRNGQPATFTVDAFPGRSFEGKVKQIRKAAQNVSNVVTYMAEVSAPNPDNILLPGMTANVRIVTDSRGDVIKVPNAALRYRPPVQEGQAAGSGRRGADGAERSAGGSEAAGANAATAANGGRGGAGGGANGMQERLVRELQLTEEQTARLEPIMAALREKMAGLRELPQEERRKAGDRARQEMRAQVAGILTPEQQKKFDELNAEAAERRGGSGVAGGQRGTVYIVGSDGRAQAVTVRSGVTDGAVTEIIAGDLKEGMQVVIGNVQSGDSGRKATPTPPAGPRMF